MIWGLDLLGPLIGCALPAVVVMLGLGIHGLFRRRRRRLTLRERCLVCGSLEVQKEGDSSAYQCSDCGFDSRWTDDERRTRGVRLITELHWALEELRSARESISPLPFADDDQYGEAGPKIMAAITILQRLMKDLPQLASLSIVREDDEGAGRTRELLGPSQLRMRRQLDEATEAIQALKKEIGEGLVAKGSRQVEAAAERSDAEARARPPRQAQRH